MKHSMSMTANIGSLRLKAHADFDDEIIIISGDNGSGKTTLLRCLVGLETRAQGQWQLHQQCQWMLPIDQRRIGCVWTNAALLPWLNVLQNIQLGLKPSLMVDQCFNALHIQHLFDQRPTMLSTGEAQRVSLARAIVMQPKMLVLDEPFSAQAPDIRQTLRLWLKEQQKKWQIPILMVSHDRDDVQALADQHWHMQEGQLCTQR